MPSSMYTSDANLEDLSATLLVCVQPSMTIPTAVGVSSYNSKPNFKATGLEDLDFHIGHEAIANSATHSVNYPVRHGMVS